MNFCMQSVLSITTPRHFTAVDRGIDVLPNSIEAVVMGESICWSLQARLRFCLNLAVTCSVSSSLGYLEGSSPYLSREKADFQVITTKNLRVIGIEMMVDLMAVYYM